MALKVVVYGSLRAGMGNNRVIDGAKLLSTETVSLPFEMIDMGSYPGLIRSDEVNDIEVEVYEVNPQTYRRVEQLEGYPSFYNRELIETKVGAGDIYFLDKANGRDYDHYTRVTKTVENKYDWVKHLENSRNSRNYND
jgi:gamma-glutamylcyclotransferase (GGCT)/AIG2-like uncharacterized protein YtfP